MTVEQPDRRPRPTRHRGPVVLREIVRRCVSLGARLAGPGEFTRRAVLPGA